MAKNEKIWRKIVKVKGNSLFPMDMLRYDRCYPLKGEDAQAMGLRDSERTVTLVFVGLHSNEQPTVDRWKSFGWTVTSVEDMD